MHSRARLRITVVVAVLGFVAACRGGNIAADCRMRCAPGQSCKMPPCGTNRSWTCESGDFISEAMFAEECFVAACPKATAYCDPNGYCTVR